MASNNFKIEYEMVLSGKRFRQVKRLQQKNHVAIFTHSRIIENDLYEQIKITNRRTGKVLDEKIKTNLNDLDKLNKFRAEWSQNWRTFLNENDTVQTLLTCFNK